MEQILSFALSIAFAFSSLIGVAPQVPASLAISESSSVELGLREVSPKGEAGGFAIPASGCSAASPEWHGAPIHDCATFPDISVDKPIIRLGDPVEVSWDPRTHANCILSGNVMELTPVPNPNSIDSRTDYPTGETTYTITCEGAGNTDSASVKVLPRIQET